MLVYPIKIIFTTELVSSVTYCILLCAFKNIILRWAPYILPTVKGVCSTRKVKESLMGNVVGQGRILLDIGLCAMSEMGSC